MGVVDSLVVLWPLFVERRLFPCRSCHKYLGAVRQDRQPHQKEVHVRHARGVRQQQGSGDEKGGARVIAVLIFRWTAPALQGKEGSRCVHGTFTHLGPALPHCRPPGPCRCCGGARRSWRGRIRRSSCVARSPAAYETFRIQKTFAGPKQTQTLLRSQEFRPPGPCVSITQIIPCHAQHRPLRPFTTTLLSS